MTSPTPQVDVVVPVYRGLEQTRACLDSVLATPPTVPFRLVVIDDASPDDAIRVLLDDLAARGRIHLERHTDNRGFVVSANRGMALHPERDVVLLNSDTVVYGDWLARLRACAYREEDIASASPFSNNASILSYPHPDRANALPEDIDGAGLDALCTRFNAGRSIDIPVSVGFCMYLRRTALDDVGLFDAERFGLGYGEECDWCLRARARGWRHRLCADTFVQHVGGVSFSERATELNRAAQVTLMALYPHYNGLVMAFQTLDPARSLRRVLDRARLDAGTAAARTVLTEREQEVDRLQTELAGSRKQSEALRHELDRAVQALNEHELALARAEGFTREREADIRTAEARLEKVLAEFKHVCEELNRRDAQLRSVEQLLAERDERIGLLETELQKTLRRRFQRLARVFINRFR